MLRALRSTASHSRDEVILFLSIHLYSDRVVLIFESLNNHVQEWFDLNDKIKRCILIRPLLSGPGLFSIVYLHDLYMMSCN